MNSPAVNALVDIILRLFSRKITSRSHCHAAYSVQLSFDCLTVVVIVYF